MKNFFSLFILVSAFWTPVVSYGLTLHCEWDKVLDHGTTFNGKPSNINKPQKNKKPIIVTISSHCDLESWLLHWDLQVEDSYFLCSHRERKENFVNTGGKFLEYEDNYYALRIDRYTGKAIEEEKV